MDIPRITRFLKSRRRLLTKCLIALALFLLAFKLGVFVGYRKAAFSYRWSENYHKNFSGPPPRGRLFFGTFGERNLMNGHGIVGSLVRVDGDVLIIKNREDTEVLVRAATGTVIRMRDRTITATALPPDTPLVVLGRPGTDGVVDARLIRVLPPPPPIPFNAYIKTTSTYETQ